MSDRMLLRGGYVLSMDESVGELPGRRCPDRGWRDRGGRATISTCEDAEVLDVSRHVVMPGFVDTHRHTWQTPFRGVCADWTLEDYFRGIRMSISPNCSAEDVYAGNYVGCARSPRRRRHDDSRLLPLQQHARARRRRPPGPARRRHPRDVRLRLLPRARGRAGVHRARAAPRGRPAHPRAAARRRTTAW